MIILYRGGILILKGGEEKFIKIGLCMFQKNVNDYMWYVL